MTEASARHSDYPITPIFLERWSPRAFDGSTISEAELLGIIEAARWAPSSYNSQPWRFLYALRETPAFGRFLDLLVPFNQSWAKSASALLFIVSDGMMGPPDQRSPSYSHSFDAGAAWMSFALQALHSGWHTHGMTGFDVKRAPAELNVPAEYRVEAAIAIGRIGDKSVLPEALQALEDFIRI